MKEKFLFGVSSSATQIEGDYPNSGKTMSIWDTFCDVPGNILNGDNVKVACDFIHKYKDDVMLMKELGINSYRFSISWSRIITNGIGKVNKKGITFYSDLIDLLLSNGIEPVITLYHWDLPQELENKGGFLSPDFPKWFLKFTKTVVDFIGDRAKNYITFNEPINAIHNGYYTGFYAPGKKVGEENTFYAMVNMHKAHGLAAKYISENVKDCKVSLAISTFEEYPADDSSECFDAVYNRFFTKMLASESVSAYLDPIYLGKYPEYCYQKFPNIMKKITKKDLDVMHKYTNALSLNNYSGYPFDKDGNEVSRKAMFYSSSGVPFDTKGIEYGIRFLTKRYPKFPIYITENGMANDDILSSDGCVHDENRLTLIKETLDKIFKLIAEGYDIRSYFVWSIFDNFEWLSGYKHRYGLVYIDYKTLNRIKKDSFYGYQKLIEKYKN